MYSIPIFPKQTNEPKIYLPSQLAKGDPLYLPLQSYAKVEHLIESGYRVRDEDKRLVKIAKDIESANEKKKALEQKKNELVEKSMHSYVKQSAKLTCPYCLGMVNKNSREYKGILCCLYDMITEECDGNVSYSVDAKNLLFRLPIEEEYKCELKGRKLELIYNSPYIKEEIENRKRFIQANISIDSTISKIFPLMISVKRTNQHFKELVHELMQKDAIDWLNTLSFQELERLLESEEEI